MKEKTVEETKVEIYHIIRPSDLNASQRLFGGTLMAWIDEAAFMTARKHAEMNITTASVNNLKFLKGVYLKDVVVLFAKVTYVGNSSMEVKVDTFVEHMDGSRDLVNSAYLTMVGLDEHDKPQTLPRLILSSDEEREEWNNALIRRKARTTGN